MTEQDTFDALRRTPYQDMANLISVIFTDCTTYRGKARPNIAELLEKHGWTAKAYREYRQKNKQ